MHYTYKTKGTCSTTIDFDLEGDTIHNVKFTNGCNGNLNGIGRLVEGRSAKETSEILKGTTCGFKSTSCPDQLSKALQEAIASAQQ